MNLFALGSRICFPATIQHRLFSIMRFMSPIRTKNRRAVTARSRPLCEAIEGRVLLAAQLPVMIAVTSNLNPANSSDDVQFTATVIATGGTPTGPIEILDGTADLGIAQLSNGSATIDVGAHLGSGTHSITAFYQGDANFQAGSSAVLSQF